MTGNSTEDKAPDEAEETETPSDESVPEDIAEALNQGRLKGYATDVWYSDPPENTLLAKAPNVLMMPHIGASTKENLLRIGDIIDELIGKYAKNEL